MIEYWKAVVGYKGYYEVSNLGRIRSLDRSIIDSNGFKRNIRGRYFKLKPNNQGYIQAMLRKKGSIKKNTSVHRIVCRAFNGPAPKGKTGVNHLDGDKTNNKSDNVEWSSQKENVDHAIKTGLNTNIGEGHGMSKLTAVEVLEIRELLETTNRSQQNIAGQYKVSREVIKDIKTKRTWKHLLNSPKSGKRVFLP